MDADDLLADALADILPEAPVRLSVAIVDLDAPGSGAAAYGGGDGTHDTASIVKVDILAALLLQAQDAGRRLTAQERAHASAMIETSDNASATALWHAIGGADGLDSANARLGLTRTRGGGNGLWGLTQTTAKDQVALLRAVFGSDPVLSETSRTCVRQLMGRVATGQDWGVSAAGGSGRALKNGWLRRSTTGLWVVNSVGRVTVDGHRLLLAVLSAGNASLAEGIATVEAAAQVAAGAFTR
ncbi:serine hydrolase [Streptomyces sp. NPDC002004]